MSRDFFDELTDPTQEPCDLAPANETDRRLLEEWTPLLALLRAGAPENGIDLIPRWERMLRDAAVEPVRHGPTRWQRWGAPVLRQAAVLLIGLALGATGGWAAVGKSQPAGKPRAGDHYSMDERQLMFRVLSQENGPDTAVSLQARGELARCVGCHAAALKDRLGPVPLGMVVPRG